MKELVYGLLDAPMGAPGYFAIGWVILALISLSMMVVDLARDKARRAGSAGLLVAAIAFAAANIGVFIVSISLDAFAIFDLVYILSVGIVAPALMMIAFVIFARIYKWPGWLSTLGFAVWIGCVAFAHLFVIAAASASV